MQHKSSMMLHPLLSIWLDPHSYSLSKYLSRCSCNEARNKTRIRQEWRMATLHTLHHLNTRLFNQLSIRLDADRTILLGEKASRRNLAVRLVCKWRGHHTVLSYQRTPGGRQIEASSTLTLQTAATSSSDTVLPPQAGDHCKTARDRR